MRSAWILAGLLALVHCGALAGQDLVWEDAKKKPRAKVDCLDGVKYDDGKLEQGLRPGGGFEDNLVMLFESPTYPVKLEKLCVYWRKSSFWNDIWFDVRIWKADGAGGAPGTRVTEIGALYANKIPPKGKFYTYDVAWMNIVIDGPVYIGPFWDPLDHFLVYLGMDTGPKTPRQRGFFNTGIFDDRPPQTELGQNSQTIPSYRALGIRAKFGPP